MKYPVNLKYNLHRDGSPIWQVCNNESEYKKNVKQLKKDGYNPRVDLLTFKTK